MEGRGVANREAMTVARKPCPCGGGQVQIVLTYDDSDWGARDQDWHGMISCERCKPLYAFVGAGRGADVVRVEDKEHCEKLRREAATLRERFLASAEVEDVFERVATALDALSSAAARHRLAVQLKLETATLATFRKHMRGCDTRRWLASRRHLSCLPALFAHSGLDRAPIHEVEERAYALEEQAFDALRPVMSLGPISLFARPRDGL